MIFRRTVHTVVHNCSAALLALAVSAASGAAQSASPGAGIHRQIVSIPSPDGRVRMRMLIVRPNGAGPFPLALVNHGSTQSAEGRAAMKLQDYPALTNWFVARGYVVALPERLGHGRTGGPYLEDQRGCEDADFKRAGFGAADSIETALINMRARSYVAQTGTIIVGQSAGGWGALALASRNPKGVAAIVNFAGGRGGHSYERPNNNCASDRLIDTARLFGRTARIPTLWVYTENDSYFPPALSRQMVDAFRAAGGIAEYRLLPAYGNEGHLLAEARNGAAIWGAVLEQFLARKR